MSYVYRKCGLLIIKCIVIRLCLCSVVVCWGLLFVQRLLSIVAIGSVCDSVGVDTYLVFDNMTELYHSE